MVSMNSSSDTSRASTPGDGDGVDLQLEISVYVAKPMRGCSDVTLADAGNGGQVLHQDHIKAGEAEHRRKFLDDALAKHPGLTSLRDQIDLEISRRKLDWDRTTARSSVDGKKGQNGPKFWRQGNTILWAKDGRPAALCNFYAEITTDVLVTDGVDDRRYYEVRIETDKRAPQTRLILASEFDSMEWITAVGSWYTISGDVARCNKLVAEAIRTFNLTHGERIQHGHTGWIEQDGKPRFLTASGALGEGGLDLSLKTAVQSEADHLGYYKLVDPPVGDALAAAAKATLKLLELSRDRSKVWPLVGILYATPILEIDFSTFCAGRTGAFKTSTQRVFLAHTGVDWCERSLPSFKNATAFGLQLLQFRAKDMVLLVDDYQRPSTRAGTERINHFAQNVFQNQADRGGRIKGNADGSQHSVKPPRCSLISNGEDIVPGLSTTARQLAISYQKDDIDKVTLAECQQAAKEGTYVQAYSGYIRWLAADYEVLHPQAAAQELAYRSTFTVEGQHGRTANNLAQTMVGIRMYLDWCRVVGAISYAQHEKHYEDAIQCLRQIGSEQKAEQNRQDPVNVFLESILEAMASGHCHVTGIDGCVPANLPSSFGWVRNENGEHSRCDPRGPRIGYLDLNGNLCLMLKTAMTVLQKESPAGEMLTIGHAELGRQLAKEGKVVTDRQGNYAKPMKVNGASVRLTCIKADAFEALLPT